MQPRIERIGTRRATLGEGPLWDPASSSLFWLDAMQGCIVRSGADGSEDGWTLAGALIGSMALRDHGDEGGAIVALRDGFYAFDFAGGKARALTLPESGNAAVRFNDGKCDRRGRFFAGTSVRGGTTEALAKLYRLDIDGRAVAVESELQICNGPCFSPDGNLFYLGDSLRRLVWVYDYDQDSGMPAGRRIFFDAAPYGWMNDGATVDADGCLWLVLATAGRVIRLTPQGRIDRSIEMPVPHPTSAMFGGDRLDTLYVTSLRETPSGRLKATDSLSGSLFAVTGLGVQGVAECRYAG